MPPIENRLMKPGFIFFVVLLGTSRILADDVASESVEQLANRTRASVVVISSEGREPDRGGLGTGFFVGGRGLIATNLHVIGQRRAFKVQTADGIPLKVLAVHASDRFRDLAIIRVDTKTLDQSIEPLPLGEAKQSKPGTAVVVMGNPHGLKHSVVSGVISGTRQVEDQEMLQLAVPIEPGNSGGPVLDMQGRVLGVVTRKSVTENLGFAMQADSLKTLLEKPNPVPYKRWSSAGQLNAKQ